MDISGGFGPTSGVAVRLGLMGINANRTIVDKIINFLNDVRRFVDINGKLIVDENGNTEDVVISATG